MRTVGALWNYYMIPKIKSQEKFFLSSEKCDRVLKNRHRSILRHDLFLQQSPVAQAHMPVHS